ncbi:uncharacterized protein LOC135374287 [Ornithodoros turicata]|uniref:uncharacterized protein LOC135374287 n=1 Tax=Ornithodoros turicata TaxID=34597 RepID=UPI003139515B
MLYLSAKCTRDPTSTFQDTFDVFIAVNNAVATAHSRRGKVTEMLKDIRLGIRFTRATSLCAPQLYGCATMCGNVVADECELWISKWRRPRHFQDFTRFEGNRAVDRENARLL